MKCCNKMKNIYSLLEIHFPLLGKIYETRFNPFNSMVVPHSHPSSFTRQTPPPPKYATFGTHHHLATTVTDMRNYLPFHTSLCTHPLCYVERTVNYRLCIMRSQCCSNNGTTKKRLTWTNVSTALWVIIGCWLPVILVGNFFEYSPNKGLTI